MVCRSNLEGWLSRCLAKHRDFGSFFVGRYFKIFGTETEFLLWFRKIDKIVLWENVQQQQGIHRHLLCRLQKRWWTRFRMRFKCFKPRRACESAVAIAFLPLQRKRRNWSKELLSSSVCTLEGKSVWFAQSDHHWRIWLCWFMREFSSKQKCKDVHFWDIIFYIPFCSNLFFFYCLVVYCFVFHYLTFVTLCDAVLYYGSFGILFIPKRVAPFTLASGITIPQHMLQPQRPNPFQVVWFGTTRLLVWYMSFCDTWTLY